MTTAQTPAPRLQAIRLRAWCEVLGATLGAVSASFVFHFVGRAVALMVVGN